jgi:hypothetical protein
VYHIPRLIEIRASLRAASVVLVYTIIGYGKQAKQIAVR